MKEFLRISFVAGVALAAALSQADMLDWVLKGTTGYITSGRPLTLYNVTDKENLKYGSRTWGINLVWDKNARLNVKIEHNGPAGTAIVNGEPVAVYVAGGGYLKYEKRTVGINLGWSSAPVYEWKISSRSGPGERTRGEDPICMLNTRAQDCLIYDTRRMGINLVWSKDKGKQGWLGLLNKVTELNHKLGDWLKQGMGGDKE